MDPVTKERLRIISLVDRGFGGYGVKQNLLPLVEKPPKNETMVNHCGVAVSKKAIRQALEEAGMASKECQAFSCPQNFPGIFAFAKYLDRQSIPLFTPAEEKALQACEILSWESLAQEVRGRVRLSERCQKVFDRLVALFED